MAVATKSVVAGKGAKAKKLPLPVAVNGTAKSSTNGTTKVDKKAKKAKEVEVRKGKSTVAKYEPIQGSMRYFILKALKTGGTPQQLKALAAQAAKAEKVSKFAKASAYEGFDVAFFVKVLNERGVKVTETKGQYKLG